MIQMTEAELKAFGKQCAAEALAEVGLGDEAALRDMRDIRDFINSWRLAKREIFKNVIGGIVKFVTAAVLLGMALMVGAKLGGFH